MQVPGSDRQTCVEGVTPESAIQTTSRLSNLCSTHSCLTQAAQLMLPFHAGLPFGKLCLRVSTFDHEVELHLACNFCCPHCGLAIPGMPCLHQTSSNCISPGRRSRGRLPGSHALHGGLARLAALSWNPKCWQPSSTRHPEKSKPDNTLRVKRARICKSGICIGILKV